MEHPVHRWTGGEGKDALDATWTDDETVTSGHEVTATHRTYEMDGMTTLGEGDRLRTVLTLADKADTTVSRGARG